MSVSDKIPLILENNDIKNIQIAIYSYMIEILRHLICVKEEFLRKFTVDLKESKI